MMNRSRVDESGQPPDVTIEVDTELFPCHRSVLIRHSKYFETLFNGSFIEANNRVVRLPPKYVDKSCLPKLLDAMYGESWVIRECDLVSLFATASYLQLDDVMNRCGRFIKFHIDTIDLTEIIVLPQLRESTDLRSTVMRYMCRHFSKLQTKMVELPLDLIEEFLNHEELLLFNRKHVFQFIELWLNHHQQERKNYREEISRLLFPFQNYQEASVVERCQKYIRVNFRGEDYVKLLVAFGKETDHPVYHEVKRYICENIDTVPVDELENISFPVLLDFLFHPELFDMESSFQGVLRFYHTCIYRNEDRRAYVHEFNRHSLHQVVLRVSERRPDQGRMFMNIIHAVLLKNPLLLLDYIKSFE